MYEFYGPGLGAMGFSDPRGTCTEVSGGEARCFRGREAAAAARRNCLSLETACEVGGDDGTMYCCPQFGETRPPAGTAQAVAPVEEDETLFEQGWEWFRDIVGGKGEQLVSGQPAPMPGATPDGKPSASGFSQYAAEVAIREVAAVDEDEAPIQEVPPDSQGEQRERQRSWVERYQTHVTIASTLIGLGTFVVWLMVRKKEEGRLGGGVVR